MHFKKYAVLAALFTFALAGLSVPASAQQYKATFTLPVEAHWGTANLQPGDYTVSTETIVAIPVIRISGNGIDTMILGGPVTGMDVSDNGHLELTEVNGEQAVTKLVAAAVGKEYSFAIPKALSKQTYRGVALQKATIPVANSK